MRAFVQRGVFVLLALLAARGDGLRGQWKIVVPSGAWPLCRAMYYGFGTLWVGGANNIAFSQDTGRTWTNCTIPGVVEAIDFISEDTGIVSAQNGYQGVYRTTDRGKTWTLIFGGSDVIQLAYNHSSSIIYALDGGNLMMTFDGGKNWFTAPYSGSFTVARDRTIYTLQDAIYTSTDLGVNWSKAGGMINAMIGDADGYPGSLNIDSCDESMYLINDDGDYIYAAPDTSIIYRTDNYGYTWTPCITLTAPKLAPGTAQMFAGPFALSRHAEYVRTSNDGIVRSTDRGLSWKRIGGPDCRWYFQGFCTINDNIIFAADSIGNIWETTNSGGDSVRSVGYDSTPTLTIEPKSLFQSDTITCDSVTRSIKFTRGGCAPPAIWKSYISGSDSSYRVAPIEHDSIAVTLSPHFPGNQVAQLILQISDGTADTVNLGGYVRSGALTFSLSPDRLFSTDSLYRCEQSAKGKVFIRSSACSLPKIVSEKIVGVNAGDYLVTKLADSISGYDSLEVTFMPSDTGVSSAQYELTLDNGTNITIPLLGYGIPTVPLSLSSINETTDTLGGNIVVPITISGLTRSENVDLVLHYDTILKYQGSYDPSNAKLDIPGEQWQGRSKLHIAQAVSGVVAGYAHFTVFADSGAKPQVTFDSLTMLSAVSPCEYTLPAAVTSTITPPSGCGMPILSQYLQSGQIPNFSIRPNPSTGDVELTSTLNLGAASVEVYDMLGQQRGVFAVTLTKDSPAHLTLPEGAGMYYLRVKSVAGVSSLRVVVAK